VGLGGLPSPIQSGNGAGPPQNAERKRGAKSAFIFVSERGAPFTVFGLAKLIERAGIEATIGFKVHPHMLRHATGLCFG
jgi:site-specific recombinase XerD